jgi:hypothetical protein
MGSWISGFGVGLAVGSTVMLANIPAARRRTLRTLETLLENGNFKLCTPDGHAVDARSLVEALDSALGPGTAKAVSNKTIWLALIAGFVAAVAAFLSVTLTQPH